MAACSDAVLEHGCSCLSSADRPIWGSLVCSLKLVQGSEARTIWLDMLCQALCQSATNIIPANILKQFA